MEKITRGHGQETNTFYSTIQRHWHGTYVCYLLMGHGHVEGFSKQGYYTFYHEKVDDRFCCSPVKQYYEYEG